MNRSARRASEFGRQVVDVIDNASGKVVGQVAAAGVTIGGLATQAMAAVPAAVTTAITDAGTDAAAVAAAVFIAIIGVWAVKRMRTGL